MPIYPGANSSPTRAQSRPVQLGRSRQEWTNMSANTGSPFSPPWRPWSRSRLPACSGGTRPARAAERPGHPHLVAQRHHRPDQVDLAEGRRPTTTRRTPTSRSRSQPLQNEDFPTKVPLALQSAEPAGRLPVMGRRRPGFADQLGQGRRHHRRHEVVDHPDHRQVRRRTGRSTAGSTACRSTSTSSASGTARTSSAGGDHHPAEDDGRAEHRRLAAEGRRTSRRSRSAARTAGRTPSTSTTSRSANARSTR